MRSGGRRGGRVSRRRFAALAGLPVLAAAGRCLGAGVAPASGASPSSGGGALAAASPEAAAAGRDVLAAGGNAADAAVAVGFVLGVTEPAMSGPGGGTQVLLAAPGRVPVAVQGATLAPGRLPREVRPEHLTYHRRSTVPSTVKVLAHLHRRHGSGRCSWAELIAPAVEHAERGFVPGPLRRRVQARSADALRRSPHGAAAWLPPGGDAFAPFRQRELAATLRRLGRVGPEDFYAGAIARAIDRDMAANGGWVTAADLAAFPEPLEVPALQAPYRDREVYAQPPPCGGWTLLLALRLLALTAPEALQPGPGRDRHVLEALVIAHGERTRRPVTDLEAWGPEVARALDPRRVRELRRRFRAGELAPRRATPGAGSGGETTHYSIVDADGLAVAVTASINAYYGARAALPGHGFLYNSYMDDFVLGDPTHPFALAPRRPNFSSMSPTVLRRAGRTELVLGSPGSARIISAVAQLVQAWVDTPVGLGALVAAPRLHGTADRVFAEDRARNDPRFAPFLARGWAVGEPRGDLEAEGRDPWFGGVHAVGRRDGGAWMAAADPRRDGRAHALPRPGVLPGPGSRRERP